MFITLDVAALVVQAYGGAKASKAAENNTDTKPGGDIMLYGIIVQLVGVSLVCLSDSSTLAKPLTQWRP